MAVTAVTAETLFRFVFHSLLRGGSPLIITSLEVTHGQDNGGVISFVAIVENREKAFSLANKKSLNLYMMGLSKIEWFSFFLILK